MARPRKLNVDWFKHSSNLRNDRRIVAIRNKFGQLVGYGLYLMLLEILAEADNHFIDFDAMEVELHAAIMGVEAEFLTEFVSYCCRLKLFAITNNKLTSPVLLESLSALYEKRSKEQKTPNKLDKIIIGVDNSVSDVDNGVIGVDSTQRRGEEIRKEKKILPFLGKDLKTFKNEKEELPPPSSAAPPPSVDDAAILDDAGFFSEMVRYANKMRTDLDSDVDDFVRGILGKLKLKAKNYENYRTAAMSWIRREKVIVKKRMPEKTEKTKYTKKILIR